MEPGYPEEPFREAPPSDGLPAPQEESPAEPRPEPQPSPAPQKKKRGLLIAEELIKAAAFLLLGAAIALLIVPNTLLSRVNGTSASDKLDLLAEMIGRYYIDGDSVDRDAMADALAAGYVYGLGDPYSLYFTADAYAEILNSNQGNMTGIGVTVTFTDDPPGARLIYVYEDSPAQKAGLLPGDLITAIGGVEITGESYEERLDFLRSETGGEVELVVLRDGQSFTVSVARADFVVQSVFSRTTGDVGVIEITGFNWATTSQFRTAIADLQEAGVRALILDLRGNSGGLMDVASEILDILLPEGELGYAVYNGGKRETLAHSDAGEVDLPMAVLTDGGTASAAEYFTLAMRDFDKAIVVGETTYGKGIMQNTYPLGDGSAVRLTVAKFYTPSGTEFHGVGVAPDVEASLPAGVNRHLIPEEEDVVLQAALAALKE